MLGTIRKFSSSIYAKIFLFIVAIPFIFWGMGPVFQGGKQNVIVEIGKDKIQTQEFINYIRNYATQEESSDANFVEKMLSNFIGEKLIAQEIKDFDIKLSKKSLGKTIKNQEVFIKQNKFSRTEYEKFLVKNSLDAVSFESNMSKLEKKEHLFNFIEYGIVPSDFMVNRLFYKINQKRIIQVINLNEVFEKKLNFKDEEIKSYFNQNKDTFIDIYKSIKFIKLSPKNLTGRDEFNDLFFKVLDEIDDLVVVGRNLDYILQKYKLGSADSAISNKLGKNKSSKPINNFPTELIKNVFNINISEPTVLIEYKNKYFIVELIKTESVQKEINNESVKNEVLLNLKKRAKRKLIAKFINKINKNNFNKSDFDQLSKDENVTVKKVKLENQNDDKIFKKEFIDQIYVYPEKKVILVADIGLSENFLIYIDKIENVSIDKNSADYKKYFSLSRVKIVTRLYNTYDYYLKKKYKININYQALDGVKSNL